MKIVLTLLAAILGLSDIDTRVGTASADSPTASVFGSAGEVYGNCVPCVTEPNGMTGWTAQTRISEKKGVAPYYYDDGEWLPIFPLWGSYTCAMIGDHCISAIADAYTKGICNFDVRTAWEAVEFGVMPPCTLWQPAVGGAGV